MPRANPVVWARVARLLESVPVTKMGSHQFIPGQAAHHHFWKSALATQALEVLERQRQT
jgi:hypothetical protein